MRPTSLFVAQGSRLAQNLLWSGADGRITGAVGFLWAEKEIWCGEAFLQGRRWTSEIKGKTCTRRRAGPGTFADVDAGQDEDLRLALRLSIELHGAIFSSSHTAQL